MTLTVPRRPVTEAQRRISPIEREVAESGCYLLSEAADIIGVAPITLRRLLKNPEVKAPSRELIRGGYKSYLYTQEDLVELKRYFGSRSTIQKRSA
jgi:hypothetical protein